MNRRGILQQPDATSSTGYAEVSAVWFGLVTSRGAFSEPMRGGGPVAIGSRLLRMPYREDVRADWRLVEGTRKYLISGCDDPDGRRRELHVVCAEIQ